MAYEDWDAGFQDVWDEMPGVPLFRDYEYGEAEILYEFAFVDRDITPDERHWAREEFFAFTGLPEELFPWDDWREAMGYGDD